MKVVIFNIMCCDCKSENSFTINLDKLEGQKELVCHCGISVGFIGKYE